MKIIELYQKGVRWLENLRDLPLLFIRIVLAYGFFMPAKMKWNDINAIAGWFESMDIPAPALSAHLAASTEMAAVILLPLGFATRILSIPLMFTMVIAIVTVHLGNGFNAGDNGLEIPLYYMLMLFLLLIYGAGRFSIDHVIARRMKR